MVRQGIRWLLVILTLALGSLISLQHPLGGPIALVCFVGTAAIAFWRPGIFLTVLPAAIPVIGLAPWSGWLSFEEFDLAVLAFAAGGYGRWAVSSDSRYDRLCPRPLFFLFLLIWCVQLVSMARGFADAGGFEFGLDQGYDGPMNSLRLAKSFFLASLLTPLIVWLSRNLGGKAPSRMACGLALGFGFVALAALWERLAFTGLLNFSSDYRSTALFWEMHVGGAALDGWLVLTAPFAIWALRKSPTPVTKAAAIALAFLGCYAILTTFSRATYLAVAVAFPFLLWRLGAQASAKYAGLPDGVRWTGWHWGVAGLFFCLMAAPMFAGGGYRGVLALLGLTFVALSLPPAFRKLPVKLKFATVAGGLLGGAFLIVVSNFIPKGPYLLHFSLLTAAVAILYRNRQLPTGSGGAVPLIITFFAMLPATANIAGHWGGVEALPGALLALSILALPLAAAFMTKRPLWPTSLGEHMRLIAVGTASAGLVAALLGGAYIGERFSTTEKDLHGRIRHWEHSLSMLQSPGDVLFGKGLGRFPANYFFAAPDNVFPGSYRVGNENDNSFLMLQGGNYSISFGDILRVTQRIDGSAVGPFHIRLRVRAKTDAGIYVEVCDRHLIYPENCIIHHFIVKADPDSWQVVEHGIDGRFAGHARTFRSFAVGLLTQRGVVAIDDIELSTPRDGNLLSNGDFSRGSERWFMTSDRDHLPWHAKNLLVNLLFDQGIVGLGLFLVLSAAAFWRTSFGGAREHQLSPYLAASLLGFWIVGIFDSLVDAPRIAFIYYLLCLHALVLNPAKDHAAGQRER